MLPKGNTPVATAPRPGPLSILGPLPGEGACQRQRQAGVAGLGGQHVAENPERLRTWPISSGDMPRPLSATFSERTASVAASD